MTPTVDTTSQDADILQEIRNNYRYASQMWREAREHRQKLMRYLSGDPWDEQDRRARADAGRPCISHDEINQYVNQTVNSARQNKRGIKIEPEGNGANDKTAELRQNIARTIEYRSRAQSIYLRGYQDCVEGAYGFCRVSRRYVDDDSDDQEIIIRPINNPDSVVYDPDCKEPDWSDAKFVFILDPVTKEEFGRLYPDAQKTSFSSEDIRVAPEWIQDKQIMVAEYWKVETFRRRSKAKSKRMVDERRIVQYVTNGVEILDKTPQPGKEIPIPAFIGMERWIDEGGGAKRRLFALPSLALDPQMSLAYFVSQEAEEAGLTPKSPYLGYVGQFETDKDTWDSLTKIPHAYAQADPIVDAASGQVLPLPQRQQFTPNFGAYEIAKESARRAIQAAMGVNPLPTAAQRQNEKSGVALQKIAAQQEIGSFHFVDGFDRAVTRIGRIVDSWIKATYDTEREMGLHLPDESRKVVTLNSDLPDENGDLYQIGDETHDVTVATGPSASSQREAADEFLDLIVSNLKNLPIPPPAQAKLLSLAILQKQLGPKGEEMAEIISPTDQAQIPPQAQSMIAQSQQQLQQLHAYAQMLEGEVQKLQSEKQGRVVDNEYRMSIEKLKLEASIAVAEVNTKAQQQGERIKFLEDAWKQFHEQAHDAAMAQQQQSADAQAAQVAAAQQQQMAAQQQAQQPQASQ